MYSNFIIVYCEKLAIDLLKYIDINKPINNLKKGKKLLYKTIYELKLIELQIFNSYIKNNLTNSWILILIFYF